MSINVQDLLVAKARKFGVSEASSDFQQIFVDALNYVIDDINLRLYLSTDAVDSTEDTIDLDADLYQGLISLWLDWYISDQGQWTVQNLDGVERKYREKLANVQTRYLQDNVDLSAKFGDLDD